MHNQCIILNFLKISLSIWKYNKDGQKIIESTKPSFEQKNRIKTLKRK